MLRRLIASPWLYFGLAALLLVLGVASMIDFGPPRRPTGVPSDIAALPARSDLNVVFILIDTLRADRLSSYGYHRPTSPVLDELAKSGVRFDHVTAQSSWTKTSMASIFTATYPATHGVLAAQHAIPEAATLPAEIFHAAGFRTGGIWRNTWMAPNFGFGQGFDLYNYPVTVGTPERIAQRSASAKKLGGSDRDVTESVVEFLRGARNERFFVYLHYMDVHQYVYDDSADFGPTLSDIYDNSIRWVDRNVGVLVAALRSLDLMRRTVIVIASDHGEGFKEHGLEGHSRTLYTEVLDVPLIVALPFRLEPGIVVEERIDNVDIFPTVLDLTGLSPLPGAQGVSLVPAIQEAAGARPGKEALRNQGGRTSYAQLDRNWGNRGTEPMPLVAVTDGPWRLIGDPAYGRVQLFDHRTDPGEQQGALEANPEVAATLWSKMEDYLARPVAAWGRPVEVAIDRLRMDQLRALGYDVGQEAAERVPPESVRDFRDLERRPPPAAAPPPGS